MIMDSNIPLTEIRVDGGITKNQLCMQLQADISGINVVRPTILETTALGAAYFAGLATGVWKNTEELSKLWKKDRVWAPMISESARVNGYKNWKKAVERTFNWVDSK